MHYSYKNKGTCSQAVEFDYENGCVYNVKFIGGCRGNTQGVARLAEGMKAEEVVARCEGILCREGTSCPDQFAKAIKELLKMETEAKAACPSDIPTEGEDPDCENCPNPCGRLK